jgi:Uma2 family endonuclease
MNQFSQCVEVALCAVYLPRDVLTPERPDRYDRRNAYGRRRDDSAERSTSAFSIALDDESEPEPDVAVVAGTVAEYLHEHPTRPVLTVEVSESSLALDRLHKGSLYARAGLADYWVVNLIDRVLEVYREPVRDADAPYGWRYARREVLDATVVATPLAAPQVVIRVADLLS